MEKIYILGLSGYYHDSAAVLLLNGAIVAAAEEERFTRKKNDNRFPKNAIQYCLNEAGITIEAVNVIIFYEKPLLKFNRLIKTYLAYAPRGYRSFIAAMPGWLKGKLFLGAILRKELSKLGNISKKQLPKLIFVEHHHSHAASAFYPSPFAEAAVLCMDGVGEWATTSAWYGQQNSLKPLWQINFPHSLGLLYSAFTYYAGFKVDSGEYKLMGLAPYGEPKYADLIRKHLIHIKPDGSFRLDMRYFNYTTGFTMTSHKFSKLFGGPRREPESEITQKEMDIAASIQVVTEEIVLKLANTIYKETSATHLCLAGGVALNCVANGRLLREGPFKNIWVQPAAGDAGGAIGAAYIAWHEYLARPRHANNVADAMQGAYLGPCYDKQAITDYLRSIQAVYHELDETALCQQVAQLLVQEKVIGWFQNRMEFGPRSLGNRSILGDPRSTKMQSLINLKIKYRESFRPFAPAILNEKIPEWFEHTSSTPYMLFVAPVKPAHRCEITAEQNTLFGIAKLKVQHSTIPAVTHVDYSARLQSVHIETNPLFHRLISEFHQLTGCPMLINTSFNVRGEPIVCSPQDAYRCFMRTEMDYLVLGNYVLNKNEQPVWQENTAWDEQFPLD